MRSPEVRVIDGFLVDYEAHRTAAALSTFSVEGTSPVRKREIEPDSALKAAAELLTGGPARYRYQWYPLQDEKRLSIVHHDPCRWSGVVCLADHEGTLTRFFRHRETGLIGLPETAEFALFALERRLSPTALVEILKRDQRRPDAWETVGEIEWKANRLLLFPAARFHAPGPFWGNEPADSRLTLNFFV